MTTLRGCGFSGGVVDDIEVEIGFKGDSAMIDVNWR